MVQFKYSGLWILTKAEAHRKWANRSSGTHFLVRNAVPHQVASIQSSELNFISNYSSSNTLFISPIKTRWSQLVLLACEILQSSWKWDENLPGTGILIFHAVFFFIRNVLLDFIHIIDSQDSTRVQKVISYFVTRWISATKIDFSLKKSLCRNNLYNSFKEHSISLFGMWSSGRLVAVPSILQNSLFIQYF